MAHRPVEAGPEISSRMRLEHVHGLGGPTQELPPAWNSWGLGAPGAGPQPEPPAPNLAPRDQAVCGIPIPHLNLSGFAGNHLPPGIVIGLTNPDLEYNGSYVLLQGNVEQVP
jgi:hypothetical protein